MAVSGANTQQLLISFGVPVALIVATFAVAIYVATANVPDLRYYDTDPSTTLRSIISFNKDAFKIITEILIASVGAVITVTWSLFYEVSRKLKEHRDAIDSASIVTNTQIGSLETEINTGLSAINAHIGQLESYQSWLSLPTTERIKIETLTKNIIGGLEQIPYEPLKRYISHRQIALEYALSRLHEGIIRIDSTHYRTVDTDLILYAERNIKAVSSGEAGIRFWVSGDDESKSYQEANLHRADGNPNNRDKNGPTYPPIPVERVFILSSRLQRDTVLMKQLQEKIIQQVNRGVRVYVENEIFGAVEQTEDFSIIDDYLVSVTQDRYTVLHLCLPGAAEAVRKVSEYKNTFSLLIRNKYPLDQQRCSALFDDILGSQDKVG